MGRFLLCITWATVYRGTRGIWIWLCDRHALGAFTHTSGLATASVYFFGEVIWLTRDPYAAIAWGDSLQTLQYCGWVVCTGLLSGIIIVPEVNRPTWSYYSRQVCWITYALSYYNLYYWFPLFYKFEWGGSQDGGEETLVLSINQIILLFFSFFSCWLFLLWSNIMHVDMNIFLLVISIMVKYYARGYEYYG